jgi:hypothetical protein
MQLAGAGAALALTTPPSSLPSPRSAALTFSSRAAARRCHACSCTGRAGRKETGVCPRQYPRLRVTSQIILFSHNKLATSNRPAVLFCRNE